MELVRRRKGKAKNARIRTTGMQGNCSPRQPASKPGEHRHGTRRARPVAARPATRGCGSDPCRRNAMKISGHITCANSTVRTQERRPTRLPIRGK